MIDNPPFLPFSAPSTGQPETDAVTDVLRSGWITTGARTSELEAGYCELTGCQHAVALYSATAGMHLALHAMDFQAGEGGMFCTDDARLAARIRRLKYHDLGVDAFDRETQGRAPQAEVIEPGFGYNLPGMNAAPGVVQIKRLDEFIDKRRQLAERYLELFAAVEEISPLSQPQDNSKASYYGGRSPADGIDELIPAGAPRKSYGKFELIMIRP